MLINTYFYKYHFECWPLFWRQVVVSYFEISSGTLFRIKLYLRDMLDTIVDINIKDKEEPTSSRRNNFLSCSSSFRFSFWQEVNWKWFNVVRVMLDTMVDVDIKDKEESIKKLPYNC